MSRRRVLIVDDEDDIREVAQMSLELVGGWEATTAGSGDECVARAAGDAPDVILLDVMMPGLSGPETLARLRDGRDTVGIPVIFLTAKAQSSETRLLSELDVAGVIAKPFDPMTLHEDVSAILGWSP
ncbi:MAG: response regulator [Thermoleophilia bacterium]|nr:response regulator [Thermoleophilia bacterium]MDH4346182.1 response regulator [Thermoleophilia bacterium]